MNIKRLKSSPRLAAGIIVIITLLSVVFVQYRIKERIFKKPAAEKIKEAEAPQEPVPVKVYKTQKRDFEDNLPLLGTVKGFKEIDLKFETSGVLDSFNLKEGERIEKGAMIAVINQKDALLKLRYNEIEMEKIQKLFDLGGVSKSKLEQAKVELDSAKRDLDKTYIYAPTGGVLGTKDAEIGEFVTSSDKIATLIDDKEVFIEVGIVQRDVGRVRAGQKGKVIVDTYPDTEFDGVIDTISPVIEGRSRTQTAKLKIENSKALLLPGMFARISVAVYSAPGVIAIPNTSIDKVEKGYVAYVVKSASHQSPVTGQRQETGDRRPETGEESAEEGVIEARPIKAGYRSPDFFVVNSGLDEGELVVVETQEKLKDGDRVIVAEIQEAIF